MGTDEPVTGRASSGHVGPITLRTLLLYLVGNRRAILQVATSPQALYLGLVFVLSAGLAREYDGTDLWHEPWHLLLPLAASLGTSLVLYGLVFMAARSRGASELNFLSGYRTLLTFYWLTAPLAWLYAVPVERFLSAGDATAANLWFLAIVSAWRVLLMTRALSVWLGASFIGMFFIVMFFADSVALALAFITPKPIFNVMGGIRLSQPDAALLDAIMFIFLLGGAGWLVWFIGACIVIGSEKPHWSLFTANSASACGVSKWTWGGAVLLLAFGIALLPTSQREQQHRWRAERLLQSGELDQAIRFMSQFSREDFPPIWDPPPRMGYGEQAPSPVAVLTAIERHQTPDWVRDLYVTKLAQNSYRTLRDAFPLGDDVDVAEFSQLLSMFEKYVPATAIASYERNELWNLAGNERANAEMRDRLQTFLKTAEDGGHSKR